MHIFNMSGTGLQSIEKKYWKPLEELISQSKHYQPLLYKAMVKNDYVEKCCKFVKKKISSL